MRLLRALLDTNIVVSYLLKPHGTSPATRLVRAGLKGAFVVLLVERLIQELAAACRADAYLAERIPPYEVAAVTQLLANVAEMIPKVAWPSHGLCRDPQDEYLLAHALAGRADYLVTGDRGLLVLGQVGDLRIVTPHEFWDMLAQQSNPSPVEN